MTTQSDREREDYVTYCIDQLHMTRSEAHRNWEDPSISAHAWQARASLALAAQPAVGDAVLPDDFALVERLRDANLSDLMLDNARYEAADAIERLSNSKSIRTPQPDDAVMVALIDHVINDVTSRIYNDEQDGIYIRPRKTEEILAAFRQQQKDAAR